MPVGGAWQQPAYGVSHAVLRDQVTSTLLLAVTHVLDASCPPCSIPVTRRNIVVGIGEANHPAEFIALSIR